jgi:hypothetical protein
VEFTHIIIMLELLFTFICVLQVEPPMEVTHPTCLDTLKIDTNLLVQTNDRTVEKSSKP